MRGNFRKHWSLCFSLATKHLEKADESSNLIAIVISVLAASVILGTCVALVLVLVYRPRKKGMTFPSYHISNVYRP